jgi:hypothetical protein
MSHLAHTNISIMDIPGLCWVPLADIKKVIENAAIKTSNSVVGNLGFS